ncbi:uncharacterized protein E0L32_001136 [Thyridium curvatum]|uniref:Uncharacterized protein n=1 Tax=Thyridium curvatum TaxID=1093900 RepID=A0A507B332_9PEZI|nr:uncharacterized protein E0L32_001136 [Thyridium curvatum]TPX11318.1 hypothetical protein E0L32_001136 [Thyridium curvatum]
MNPFVPVAQVRQGVVDRLVALNDVEKRSRSLERVMRNIHQRIDPTQPAVQEPEAETTLKGLEDDLSRGRRRLDELKTAVEKRTGEIDRFTTALSADATKSALLQEVSDPELADRVARIDKDILASLHRVLAAHKGSLPSDAQEEAEVIPASFPDPMSSTALEAAKNLRDLKEAHKSEVARNERLEEELQKTRADISALRDQHSAAEDALRSEHAHEKHELERSLAEHAERIKVLMVQVNQDAQRAEDAETKIIELEEQARRMTDQELDMGDLRLELATLATEKARVDKKLEAAERAEKKLEVAHAEVSHLERQLAEVTEHRDSLRSVNTAYLKVFKAVEQDRDRLETEGRETKEKLDKTAEWYHDTLLTLSAREGVILLLELELELARRQRDTARDETGEAREERDEAYSLVDSFSTDKTRLQADLDRLKHIAQGLWVSISPLWPLPFDAWMDFASTIAAAPEIAPTGVGDQEQPWVVLPPLHEDDTDHLECPVPATIDGLTLLLQVMLQEQHAGSSTALRCLASLVRLVSQHRGPLRVDILGTLLEHVVVLLALPVPLPPPDRSLSVSPVLAWWTLALTLERLWPGEQLIQSAREALGIWLAQEPLAATLIAALTDGSMPTFLSEHAQSLQPLGQPAASAVVMLRAAAWEEILVVDTRASQLRMVARDSLRLLGTNSLGLSMQSMPTGSSAILEISNEELVRHFVLS